MKNTRRALLLSVVSMFLCVVMLASTTFAWFTDSVESTGNIIKTGTLEVSMKWADGKVDPASATWTDASTGAIFNYDKWEPGYTEVRHIKIANEGTLALKYQVNIIPTGTVSELADVIDVYYMDPAKQIATRTALNPADKLATLKDAIAAMSTTATGNLVAGESTTLTIALKMQESAGNKYQEKAIGSDFRIQLLATQLTKEEDSFDDQYDNNADYDGEISTYDALATALEKGGNFKVLNSITVPANEQIVIANGVDVVLDMGNSSITGQNAKDSGALIVNNGSLTLKNGTFTNTTENGAAVIENKNKGKMIIDGANIMGAPLTSAGYPEYAIATYGDLTVNGGSVIKSDRGAIRTYDGANLIINGGEFIVSDAADGRNMTFHTIYAYGSGAKVTIEGGRFEQNHESTGGASVICPAGATIEVRGGTFSDVMDDSNWYNTANFHNYMGYTAPVNVSGGTFNDKTVNEHIATGYTLKDNGNGTYTVVPGM